MDIDAVAHEQSWFDGAAAYVARVNRTSRTPGFVPCVGSRTLDAYVSRWEPGG